MVCKLADKSSALLARFEASACASTPSNDASNVRSWGENGGSSDRTCSTASGSSSDSTNLNSISIS